MIMNPGNFSNARLITSLVVSVALFVVLIVVPRSLGFATLDGTASPIMAREGIALMTSEQRVNHVVLTAIADSLFPLASGFLFLGVAVRFWGRLAPILVVLIAILVVTDFVENAVQILGLMGWAGIVRLTSDTRAKARN